MQELEELFAKSEAGRAAIDMSRTRGSRTPDNSASDPPVKQKTSQQSQSNREPSSASTRVRSQTETDDIEKLEAVLQAKKKRKVLRELDQDAHMDVERYDCQLIGVVCEAANQVFSAPSALFAFCHQSPVGNLEGQAGEIVL